MNPDDLSDDERLELLNETYDALRRSQGGASIWLIGGPETDRLWDATLGAFVHGNWVATILCAQATCERTLAALIHNVFAMGEAPKGWEWWGLGSLVKYCRKEKFVDGTLLDDVATLCEERKPYGHWRGPLDEGALQKVVLDAPERGVSMTPDQIIERHLSDLALRSARTALLVHFGDLYRPDKIGRDEFGRRPSDSPSQT